MSITREEVQNALTKTRWPRSAGYDAWWMLQNNMGPNALWLMEWLSETIELKPGMRVLDMGCGRALTSIFLAKEFGVNVYATDLWISATDNWKRICDAGVQDLVVPIHAEAHALPYAEDFFDAIVSVDAYQYFGTDACYLPGFLPLVKQGGPIGIVVPGLVQDFQDGVLPEYFTTPQPSGRPWWVPECWSFKTVDWWRDHWNQTGLVEITTADLLPDGWRDWVEFDRLANETGNACLPEAGPEWKVVEADAGRYLGFVRLVATRR